MNDIVIDLGSTSLKIAHFYGNELINISRLEYEITDNKVKISDIKKHIQEFIRNVDYDKIYVYSFAEGGAFLDKKKNIYMSDIYLWDNKRATTVYENEKNRFLKFFEYNGLLPKAKYSIFTILNEKDRYGDFVWMNASDIICHFLSGEIYTSESLAIRTGIYDIHKSRYNEELLKIYGLDTSNFASIGENNKVINCGHDHLNLLNCFNNVPIISTGTTQVVIVPIENSEVNYYYSEHNHIIFKNDKVYAMGAIEDSGSRIERFKKTNFPECSFDSEELCTSIEYVNVLSELANCVAKKLKNSYSKNVIVTGGLTRNRLYMTILKSKIDKEIWIYDDMLATMNSARNNCNLEYKIMEE